MTPRFLQHTHGRTLKILIEDPEELFQGSDESSTVIKDRQDLSEDRQILPLKNNKQKTLTS